MPRKLTHSELIERFQKIHGDVYDYSLVTYVNTNTKINILCNKDGHGIFQKTPMKHLYGHGCPDCGKIFGSKRPSKEILKSLCKGKSDREVADLFEVEKSTISKWRKSYGIKHSLVDVNSLKEKLTQEKLEKLWESGLTVHQVAKYFGTNHSTLIKYQKLNGIKRPEHLKFINIKGNKKGNTRYEVNENFFEIIDTEEKAYILGFWAADGWMYKRSLFIAVSEDDKEFLEKIRKIIPTEAPIITKIKKSVWQRKKLSILTLSRKKMYEDVVKLGFTEQKSKDLIFPKIHRDLYKYFIRGFWDGDGHIGERQFSIVGKSVIFFQELKRIIFVETNCKLHFDMVRGQYPRLTGSKKHKDVINWIYCGSNIHLKRKYQKYLDNWV